MSFNTCFIPVVVVLSYQFSSFFSNGKHNLYQASLRNLTIWVSVYIFGFNDFFITGLFPFLKYLLLVIVIQAFYVGGRLNGINKWSCRVGLLTWIFRCHSFLFKATFSSNYCYTHVLLYYLYINIYLLFKKKYFSEHTYWLYCLWPAITFCLLPIPAF